MRRLKTELADGNVYIFSTLTLKEQAIAKKVEDLPEKENDRLNKLSVKASEDKGLSNKEQTELAELQDKQVRNMLKIVMMSLAKKHSQFRITDEVTEDDILDKIEELFDIRDIKRFTTFAFVGTLPAEEEEDFNIVETIDLTVESNE